MVRERMKIGSCVVGKTVFCFLQIPRRRLPKTFIGRSPRSERESTEKVDQLRIGAYDI